MFLLLQLTHNNALSVNGRVGGSNPFTQYVQFLPSEIRLPTLWAPAQCARLKGTSLEAALDSKLKSLKREFDLLRDATVSIEWCKGYWWDPESGGLRFEDWKYIDAMYRSRALDLQGTHAMVPCIDMANHASGRETLARYDLDADGNAILLLLEGRCCQAGEEIFITYGDEKGACEMLFSYGFIEQSMSTARELYLDLDIPSDDPLKLAKKAIATSAPGFRLFTDEKSVAWEGPFVWLICVNEEDGLEFRLLQTNDGARELQLLWKGAEIDNVSRLDCFLQTEPLWEVFQLRAITVLQARVEVQLMSLHDHQSRSCDENITDDGIDANLGLEITRLRHLEGLLMTQAYDDFESQVFSSCAPCRFPALLLISFVGQKLKLLECSRVQEYLRSADEQHVTGSANEFS